MKRIFVTLILLSGLIFLVTKVWAIISITATGNWSETINALDLQSGAGSDLISTYESVSNAVSIDISATAGADDNWRVDIKKVDSVWHANLRLYVKRTSDGAGAGIVSGGASYQEITDIDQSFFSGDNDRSNINVQLKLDGVSIQVSPDNYATTIYYTVVDTD